MLQKCHLLTRAGLKIRSVISTEMTRLFCQIVNRKLSADNCQQMPWMENTEHLSTGRPLACKALWDLTSPASSHSKLQCPGLIFAFQPIKFLSRASLLALSYHLSSYGTLGNFLSFLGLNFLINKMVIIIFPYLNGSLRGLNEMVLVVRIKPGM